MSSFLTPELIWCIIGIFLLIIEFNIPTFVIFFFGIGAFLTAAMTFLFPGCTLNIQLVTFCVSSIVFLIVLRKWFKNIFSGYFNCKKNMSLNKNDFIGETGIVSQQIQPNKRGKIEFHGSQWFAVANTEIKVGETVKIIKQDNITFTVEKI